MNRAESETAVFESLRGRLFGLAYRMFGLRQEAEDIVQEAFLCWHKADRNRIDNAEAWLQRFRTALEARNEHELLELFAPDAIWTADGGGRTAAALHPIVGAERIARLVLALREKFWAVDRTLEVASINGEVGLRIRDGERLMATISIATDGERILAAYAVVNPEKLV